MAFAISPFYRLFGDDFSADLLKLVAVVLALVAVFIIAASQRVSPLLVVYVLGVILLALSTQQFGIVVLAVIPLMRDLFRRIDLRIALRVFCVTSALVLALTIGSALLLGYHNDSVMTWRIDANYIRPTLGFTHPNRAAMAWLATSLGLLLIAPPTRARVVALGLVVATAFVYFETETRTSLGIEVVLLGAVVVLGRRIVAGRTRSGARLILAVAPLAFGAVSLFVLPALSSNVWVDKILSGRPSVYGSLLDEFHWWNLFGSPDFGTVDTGRFSVDNGYLQVILGKGVVPFAVFCVVIAILILRSPKLSPRSILIVTAYLVLSLFESALFEAQFVFLLVAAIALDEGITKAYPNQDSERRRLIRANSSS